jgi:hypothetical protein
MSSAYMAAVGGIVAAIGVFSMTRGSGMKPVSGARNGPTFYYTAKCERATRPVGTGIGANPYRGGHNVRISKSACSGIAVHKTSLASHESRLRAASCWCARPAGPTPRLLPAMPSVRGCRRSGLALRESTRRAALEGEVSAASHRGYPNRTPDAVFPKQCSWYGRHAGPVSTAGTLLAIERRCNIVAAAVAATFRHSPPADFSESRTAWPAPGGNRHRAGSRQPVPMPAVAAHQRMLLRMVRR